METERKVEIRVRILGQKDGKISWKIYPPLVLDVDGMLAGLGDLGKRWVPKQGAFYIRREQELVDLVKILSQEVDKRRRQA